LHIGFPIGDFGDVYDNSIGIFFWRNLFAKLRLGAIELLAGYQKFPRADGADGSLIVYPITASLVARAPDALFRPYASIGGGAYGWESRVPVPDGDAKLVTSGWDLGWTAAIGVEYYLRTRVAFDVGLRFHSTDGPGASGGISDDKLQFFTLWLGHYLRF
jgi:opacity protein-like surface antigen